MPPTPKRLDELAREYEQQRAIVATEQSILDRLRGDLIALVETHGHAPARAVKSKALLGDDLEIRVSYPAEVTVDTGTALRIRRICNAAGCGRLFGKLFHSVETFTLAGGAQKIIARLPSSAPRGIRSLFARAIRIDEKSPALEIRERKSSSQKKPEAA